MKFRKILYLLPVSLFMVYPHSFAWGFSLGQINVKTSFNKRFSAEVAVTLDGPMELTAKIGGKADYERLGLFRNPLVDQISLTIQRESDLRALLRITSEKPLFMPSFNLVLKCVHNGGTMYENFLVAADFRKQLSLNVPGREVQGVKKGLSSGGTKKEDEKKPALVQRDESPDSRRKTIAREFEREGSEKRVKPAEQIVMKKKMASDKAPSKVPAKPASVKERREFYRVLKGDTLYRVAKKIGASKERVESYVVEIWRRNLDKFYNRNMNFLEKGVSLDITGVSETSLTRRESLTIIRSQWKKRKARFFRGGASAVAGVSAIELPLPYEKKIWEIKKIAETVGEWEKRWESGDINSYMEMYSKRFRRGIYRYPSWKSFKRAFNKRHGSFDVVVHSIKVRVEKEMAVASFRQDFTSRRMKTTGTKALSFVKEGGDYKIVSEVWQREVQKEGKRPYVVHVSSFRTHELALKEINWLRKKGYSAYEILADVGKRGVYYRVVIDRFATKAEAARFARRLTVKKVVDYGNPLKMPFAIEVGAFREKSRAFERLLELRKGLFSPYPLVKCDMEECYYQILIGAYKSAGSALPVSGKLADEGFVNTVIMP